MKTKLIHSLAIVSLLVVSFNIYSKDKHKPKWVIVTDHNDITVYEDDNPQGELVSIKAETVIEAPMEKVMTVLADHERKPEWIPNCGAIKPIKIYSPYERIEWSLNESPLPLFVDDRSFLTKIRARYYRQKKKLVISIHSIPQEKLPKSLRSKVPQADAVEAFLHFSTIVLTPDKKDPNKTFLTMELKTDPKGTVPKWIVNWVQVDWPRDLLEGLKRQVKKDDIKVVYSLR